MERETEQEYARQLTINNIRAHFIVITTCLYHFPRTACRRVVYPESRLLTKNLNEPLSLQNIIAY